MEGTIRIDRPTVIDESFDGEAVVLNLATGLYYSFDPAATALWTVLASPRDITTLIAADDADGSIVAFLQLLVDEGLVVVDATAAAEALSEPLDLGGAPRLERFNELQDLLLLDPVHDIDIAGDGWPVAVDGTA